MSPGSSGVAEGCQGTGQLTARSDAIFVSQALLLIPAGSGHATTPPPQTSSVRGCRGSAPPSLQPPQLLSWPQETES